MVAVARPRTFQPSKGQLRLFEANDATSIVHSRSGSITVTSPGAPSRSVPRPWPIRPQSSAGVRVMSSIMRGQPMTPSSMSALA